MDTLGKKMAQLTTHLVSTLVGIVSYHGCNVCVYSYIKCRYLPEHQTAHIISVMHPHMLQLVPPNHNGASLCTRVRSLKGLLLHDSVPSNHKCTAVSDPTNPEHNGSFS
jgi:hypothetical protein